MTDTVVFNTIAQLWKFFKAENETMTVLEFKAEWNQLSEAEKDWFRRQTLD